MSERVLRAASYFMRVQRSTLHGLPVDTAAVRVEALACRAWLAAELKGRAPHLWAAADQV